MLDTALFIFLGVIQVAFAYWGGIVSVKSLPSGEGKRPHRYVFLVLLILGIGLTALIGIRTYQQQKTGAEERAAAVRRETALATDLAEARTDVTYMKGQLNGLGVSVGKIGQKVGDDSSFIKLAAAISGLSKNADSDPTGLYDVSINGIPHQSIRIDHKISETPKPPQ